MVEFHIEMTFPNPYKIRDGLYDATKASTFCSLGPFLFSERNVVFLRNI